MKLQLFTNHTLYLEPQKKALRKLFSRLARADLDRRTFKYKYLEIERRLEAYNRLVVKLKRQLASKGGDGGEKEAESERLSDLLYPSKLARLEENVAFLQNRNEELERRLGYAKYIVNNADSERDEALQVVAEQSMDSSMSEVRINVDTRKSLGNNF